MDISIIIPCYTAKVGPYVRDAVLSILQQRGDFHIREIILVDENEPETKSVLGDLYELTVLKVVPNEGSHNAAGARNTGLERAQSEWIAFMDADDLLLDNSFAMRCDAARQFPDCRWIGADYYWADENGNREEDTFFSSRELPKRYFAEAFEQRQPIRLSRPVVPFLQCCLSKIGANLIGRDLLDAVGPTDPDLKMSEDHQLYMRMAAISDYVFVPTPALLYRRHSNNTTFDLHARNEPPGQWPYRALKLLLERYGMERYRRDIQREMALFALADSYFFRENNNFRAGARWAREAVKLNPSLTTAWRSLAASLVRR